MVAFRRALVRRQSACASASLSFGVVISPLSTRLMPNFFVSRLNQRGATVSLVIIYMKKFLHFDWLRAVQFFSKTVQKRVNSVQKKEKNQAF